MASNYTLDSLIADLKNSAYVPKTPQELEEAANRRYQAAYDQKRLEAKQAADMNQLALDKQLSSLGTAYGRQKEAAAQSHAQTYSQANRQAVSRGMQRSSFNNANLSGIAVAGNKAQQEIADNEALHRAGLEDQKSLQAQQLSQQLTQLGAAQATDILSYLDQLESQEYDRQTAAGDRQNSLSMQIYQLAAQKDAQDTAAAQWQKEYDESLRQYDESFAEQARQYNDSLEYQKNQSTLDEQYRQNQYGENKRQFELSLAQQQKQLEEEMRQFDILHPKKSGKGTTGASTMTKALQQAEIINSIAGPLNTFYYVSNLVNSGKIKDTQGDKILINLGVTNEILSYYSRQNAGKNTGR